MRKASPELKGLPKLCKVALNVEARAVREKQQLEERTPLDYRLQKGSAIGPLEFRAIVTFNWRTKEIFHASDFSDGQKSAGKGSLCHLYAPVSGTLDSGKFKEGDEIEVVAIKDPLEYSHTRVKGEIAHLHENHVLISRLGAYPPKYEGKAYLFKQDADRIAGFHAALNVCPEWPVKEPQHPLLLPAVPPDAVKFIAGEDKNTIDAFLLCISGNQICGVQGPPGTGKTNLLSKVAAYYISKGLRVGIISGTHNAVINALNATQEVLDKFGITKPIYKNGQILSQLNDKVKPLKKATKEIPICYGATLHSAVKFCGQATSPMTLPGDSTFQSRQRDILLIDEAGQAPAFFVLALSFLAPRMIFFGDQEQLPPIILGTHADNPTAQSAMEFLLQYKGETWIKPLLVSHRMNTEICKAIQTAFYPKLPLKAGINAKLSFVPCTDSPLTAGGIDFVDVTHRNRSNRSPEEVAVIKELCKDILSSKLSTGNAIPPSEIVVLTPYLCQKRALENSLKSLGISRIGTVHSMQGQGALVVVFSLTSSSQQGIGQLAEWLFHPASWNVLISRAQAKVVIVGSLTAIEAYHAESWEGLKSKARILEIIKNPNVCQKITFNC